jgi:hypothetical protein
MLARRFGRNELAALNVMPSDRRGAAAMRGTGLLVAMVAMVALAACTGEAPPPRAGVDGWYEFQGSWNAAGNRRTLHLAGDRRASVLDLSGTLLLAGPGRPGVGFRADAIGMGDSVTGLIGRAVWTDENGNRIYSELRGGGTAKGQRVVGTFVGGTGRYAGATGDYAFTWQYVIETEDGTVQGRGTDLAGRVRLGQAGTETGAPEAKP